MGGPANCVQRWSGDLNSPANVLTIVNQPRVPSNATAPSTLAVYSFSKIPQSVPLTQLLPTSNSRLLSASSLDQDEGAQLQAEELGHSVTVWNVQLFTSLREGELASLWAQGNKAFGVWNFHATYLVAGGGFKWRAPTYAELERLLQPLQMSTSVITHVLRQPQPQLNIQVPVRPAPSPPPQPSLPPPPRVSSCSSSPRLGRGSTRTQEEYRARPSRQRSIRRSKSQVAIDTRSSSRNRETRSQVAFDRQSTRRDWPDSAIGISLRVQPQWSNQTRSSKR